MSKSQENSKNTSNWLETPILYCASCDGNAGVCDGNAGRSYLLFKLPNGLVSLSFFENISSAVNHCCLYCLSLKLLSKSEFACKLYVIGSLIFFFFTQMPEIGLQHLCTYHGVNAGVWTTALVVTFPG